MSLKISRILHAGYVFECNETKIAFDPIFENPFSRNCYAFPNILFDQEKIIKLDFAAVFISHFHDDHCSFESLNLLNKNTPIYVYCVFEELFSLIKELGFKKVYSLTIDESIQINSIEIIPRRALDSEVDSMFHIKAAGLNVLNVVDSWIDTTTLNELAHMEAWDMILWPFQTMREIEVLAPSRVPKNCELTNELPKEWIEQLKILNPKYIVPSSCQFIQESWSWYNQAFFPITYKQFQLEIEAALPNTKVIRMNPSVAIELNQISLQYQPPLDWIHPIGDQNVDYTYSSDITPPTTAEISRNFSPLNKEQTEIVFNYCHTGLLKKYASLDASDEPYFKKNRHWQLSIYDHEGIVTKFSYQLRANTIEKINSTDQHLAWTTEVPISKLYAALMLGESLTSMYMRINDITFDTSIESEINSVECVEDPLIRCLFNGSFGAYQIAQLKRIKTLVK
ncbi:MAG: MBL fold metallo-hydrolase [Pseudobdellovibrio sp.]